MPFQPGNSLGRKWEKGRSGNPAGRSKADFHLAEAARAHAPEMLDVAVRIARDENVDAGHRLKAVEIVLGRGHGRPSQALAIDQRVQQVDATTVFVEALKATNRPVGDVVSVTPLPAAGQGRLDAPDHLPRRAMAVPRAPAGSRTGTAGRFADDYVG